MSPFLNPTLYKSKRRFITPASQVIEMNTSKALSINSLSAQANNSTVEPASNGNGNGHGNGNRAPIVHLRRFAHYTWCGKDLDFHANAISSHKPSFVTCKVCAGARKKLLMLRKKAHAWEREHSPQPAVIVKRPERSGLVSVETALQLAAERAERAMTRNRP
jgi:hypothetical protein